MVARLALAGQVNGEMPAYVVQKIADSLNKFKKSVNGSKILIIGVSYKSNIDDIRESPALDVIELLRRKGAEVLYHDPLVNKEQPELADIESVDLTPESVASFDCAAVVTGHDGINYDMVLEHIPFLVDTRNVYRGWKSEKLVRL